MIYSHEHKLLSARIEEQDRAMDNFSREIRENIGQLLNFTKMNMFPIAKYATDSKQIELIENTKQLLDQLINDVHNISHSLNSDYIKINGLPQVLREELNFIINPQNVVFHIDVTGNYQSFEPERELLIYRIAREAIVNISKHASATAVSVQLDYDNDGLKMQITDNGCGFDKSKLTDSEGSGLVNMMQRAMIIDADLEINANPDKGCCVTLNVKKNT